MKVGIIGGRGWIAGMYKEYFGENKIEWVDIVSRGESRDVEADIRGANVTHVLYVAGRTHGTRDGTKYTTIDYLQTNSKLQENVRDNLYSPVRVALMCARMGVHFSYLGTGCIFKYAGEDLFTEESEPNFFGSNYSIVKGYTDQLMREIPTALNWRIRMPITSRDNPRNFISKILRYERICSVPNSMTVLDEMIPVMVEMMRNREVGTWNMTNPGKISHNEVLEMYRELVDSDFTWNNFTEEEQAMILASGRSNNELDVTKLTTKYPVSHIKDSVRNTLSNWKL